MISYMLMLDTSFVISYFNTRDQNHRLAAKIAKTITAQKMELYVTDYVFGEIVTISFLKLKNLKKALDIGKQILESCNVVNTDKDIFAYAWEIFSEQKLRLSFVDCATIATMSDLKIQKIATFDHVFLKVKGLEVLSE